MRLIEANLYPEIPFPYVQAQKEGMMSMSDYVQASSRPRPLTESKTIESRLMFGFFYVVCLVRAVAIRLMPWRKQTSFGSAKDRESIFTEARSSAGTIVTSSFMGM